MKASNMNTPSQGLKEGLKIVKKGNPLEVRI